MSGRSPDVYSDKENFYSFLIDNLEEGIGIVDSNEIFIFANPAAHRIFGEDKSLLGKSLMDYVNDDNWKKLIQQTSLRKNGEKGQYELEIITPNHITKIIQVSVSPKFDENGHFTGSFGFFSDITERKASETALRNSELAMTAILENTDDPIWSIDRNFKLIKGNFSFNKNIEEILGKELKEGDSLLPDIFGETFHKRWLDLYKRALSGEKFTVQLKRELTSENSWYEFRFNPIRDTNGNVTGAAIIGRDITESIQNEQALRRQTALFSKIGKLVKLGGWVWDFESNKVLLTDGWKELHGIDSNEIFITDLVPIAHPEDLQNIRIALNEAKTGNTSYNLEHRIIRQDTGEVRHVKSFGETEFDSEGKPFRMIGAALDFTEIKLAEKALKNSENKFRQLFEAESDALVLIDNEFGWILEANTAATALYGYAHDELVKMKNYELSAEPQDTTKVTKTTPIDYEAVIHIPLRYHKKKNGEVFPVEITGRFFTFNERPVHIAAIRDITERKRSEQALQESEALLWQILEILPIGVWIIDKTGKVGYVNSSGKKIWAVEPDKDIKDYEMFKGWWLNTGKPIEPEDWAGARAFTKGEISIEEEIEILCFDNTRKIILNFAMPIRSETGSIIGAIVVNHDITERKKNELKLKTVFNELSESKQIIESSLIQKSILVEELEKAKFELEQSNAEKDKFFSIIAHDLKGPLASFIGLSKALSEDLYSLSLTDMQKYTASLYKSSESVYNLLENLLEWSRMIRDIIQLNPDMIPLSMMVKSNIELNELKIKHKNIQTDIDIQNDFYVFADPNMLNGVLRNLISNALKFTPNGGKITISALKNSRNETEISVQDSGIGIPDNILPILFKPGERTSRTGTENESGTGLGLLLCKEYISKHNGTITVESKQGKGSKFIITLPEGSEIIEN